MKSEQRQKLLITSALILTIMLSLYFGIHYMIPMLFEVSSLLFYAFLPFILALIFSILIDPLVEWLVIKKNLQRGWAVAFVLIVLFLIISLVLIFAISRLAVELNSLYKRMPVYSSNVSQYGLDIIESLKSFFTSNPLPLEVTNALRNNIEAGLNSMLNIIASSTNVLFSILTGLPAFVTIIIVSAIATFFISRDKELIGNVLKKYIPSKYMKQLNMVKNELSNALVGFVRAQVILISITASQTIIGLYLIGVDYALTLGVIVGIFDLLPVLGPGTVLVPWAITKMILGDIEFGLYLLVLYAILVGIRQLIEPKILSQNIGIHPLATLLSMYLGLQILGIWGLIMGPFLFILAKALINSVGTNEA